MEKRRRRKMMRLGGGRRSRVASMCNEKWFKKETGNKVGEGGKYL